MGGGVINFPTRHIKWIKVEPINGSDDSSDEDYTLTGVFKKFKEALIKANPDIPELKNAIIPDAVLIYNPRFEQVLRDNILDIGGLITEHLYLYKNKPQENETFIDIESTLGCFIYTEDTYNTLEKTIDNQLYYYIEEGTN